MSFPQQPNFWSPEPKSAWWYSRDQSGGTLVCSSTYDRIVTRLKMFFRGVRWNWMSPSGIGVIGRGALREENPLSGHYDPSALRAPLANPLTMLGGSPYNPEDIAFHVFLGRDTDPVYRIGQTGPVNRSVQLVSAETRAIPSMSQSGMTIGNIRLPSSAYDEALAISERMRSLRARIESIAITPAQRAVDYIRADAELLREFMTVQTSTLQTPYATFAQRSIPTGSQWQVAVVNQFSLDTLLDFFERHPPQTDAGRSIVTELRRYQTAMQQAFEQGRAEYVRLSRLLGSIRESFHGAIQADINQQVAVFNRARAAQFARFARTLIWPGATINGDYSNLDIVVNSAWDQTFQASLCAYFRAYFGGPVSMNGVGIGQQFEALADGTSARQYVIGRWLNALPENIRAMYMQLQGDWQSNQISLTSLHVAVWLFTTFDFMIAQAIRNPNETVIPSWRPDITDIAIRRDVVLPHFGQFMLENALAQQQPSIQCNRLNIPASQRPAPGSSLIPRNQIIQLGFSEGDELAPERAGLFSDAVEAVAAPVRNFAGPNVSSRLPRMLLMAGVAGGAAYWWMRK